MTFVFSLVGNVGAGKTTLLKILEEKKHENIFDKEYIILYEPVEKWTEKKFYDNTKSILELYYENIHKYAFCFQMYTLQTRFEQIKKAIDENPGKIIITERCPFSDNMIFARLLIKQNLINDTEYMVYKSWLKMVCDITNFHVKGFLYLDVPVETCAARIIKRNRSGEENITVQYIQKLHEMHESWMDNMQETEDFIRVDPDNISSLVNFIKNKIFP